MVLGLLLGLASIVPARESNDPAEHFRRAQQAMQARDYEAAERGWKTVMALRPDLPEARSNLGLVYHLQKNYADAIEWFPLAERD